MGVVQDFLTAVQNASAPLQSAFDDDTHQINLLNGQVNDLTNQLATANGTIASQSATVQDLENKLAAAAGADSGASELYAATGATALIELQKLPWNQMPGTTANTAQSGPTGSGLYTPGDVATMLCKPNAGQGYYDAGYSHDTGQSPSYSAVVRYGTEWLLNPTDLPNAHQLELDASFHSGTNRYHPAVALNFGTKTLSAYDPAGKGIDPTTQKPIGAWVDTKVPFAMSGGVWLPLEVIGRMDFETQKFQYFGFFLNGTFIPFEATFIANPNTWRRQFKPIMQLDSGKAAVAFQAQVRHTHLVWM